MKVIDIHSHFFPKTWPNLQEKFGGDDWPWLKHLPSNNNGFDKAMLMKGNKEFRPIYSACWDAEVRLQQMDEHGLEQQIISATPILFAYEKPIEQALYCAQLFNDAALEICQQGKGRLFAMAQVPLQNIDAACKEASRAMNSGHVGIQIGNHVAEKNMDDEGVLTFLQHCASENIPVFVHPWDMMSKSKMEKYWLPWLVGMPAETSLAICSMIFGGVFERLPNLRVAFAHGGGSFPATISRIQHGFDVRPDLCAIDNNVSPKEYLGKFWLDSLVHDEHNLKYIIDLMGSDKIALGSDYPFPLGELQPGKLIRNFDIDLKTKENYISVVNLHIFV